MRTQIAIFTNLTTLTSTEVEDFNSALDHKEQQGHRVLRIETLTRPYIPEGFPLGTIVTYPCYRLGFWPAISLSEGYQNDNSLYFISTTPFTRRERVRILDGYGVSSTEGIVSFEEPNVLPMGNGFILNNGELVHRCYWRVILQSRWDVYGHSWEVLNIDHHYLPSGYAAAETIPEEVEGVIDDFDFDPDAFPEYVGASRSLLHRYHTNVVQYFGIKLEPNKLYIGLEAEMRIPASKAGEIANALAQFEINGEGIPTQDASVDAELVTIPMQPEQMKEWLQNNKEFFELIRIEDEVGAHMHVSKAAFTSQLAQAYFTIQVNKDASDFRMIWLFGDPDHYWAAPKKKSLSDWQNTDRYEAVNCINPNTIEIRAFRGTNDYETLQARVDYIVEKVKEANWRAEQKTKSKRARRRKRHKI